MEKLSSNLHNYLHCKDLLELCVYLHVCIRFYPLLIYFIIAEVTNMNICGANINTFVNIFNEHDHFGWENMEYKHLHLHYVREKKNIKSSKNVCTTG